MSRTEAPHLKRPPVNDDVKACGHDELEVLRQVIGGEPARLAAAREEQARVDMDACNEALAHDSSWSPSLTATPLADEITALRAQVEKLRTDLANADAAYAGDVSAQRVRAERAEAQVEAARALCARFIDLPWLKWAGDAGRDVLAAMDEAKP
jgi:hypothetical protein